MPESPQFVLPFAEKEYVDMARASDILGVSWQTVMRMAQSGMLRMVEWRSPSRRLVHYGSLVGFCDDLRRQYLIPDRRPTLSAPYLRHRDVDLLPFPLSITMDSSEALAAMGRSNRHIINLLVQEGRFEAYRLIVGAPWRISRPSFVAYRDEVLRGPRPRNFPLSPYKLSTSDET